MSNKMYDFLKWFSIIFVPALMTLVAGLTLIWGFKYGSEIEATIGVFGTFLGAIIGKSAIDYNNAQTKEFTVADAERLREEQPELFEEEGEN